MKRTRRTKGEGSIFYRPDKGYWVAQVDLGRDGGGARRRRTIYGKSRSDVLNKVADLRARHGGTIRPRATGTVREYLEQWLKDDVKPNRSANTFALYDGMVRKHALPLIGEKALDRFDVPDVDGLYATLRKNGAMPSVVFRVSVVLQRAFTLAVRKRIIPSNPFAIVERPTYRAKRGEALTIEEARRLLGAARSDRYEAVYVLAITAGMRLGEILGLKWSDIDFKRRALSVQRSLLEVSGATELSETKTATSRRLVDLGGLAIDALKRRQQAWKKEKHRAELVFTTVSGTELRRSNLRSRSFEPLLKKAKIRHVRFHDLRHTTASLLMAAGAQPKVVQERLGHSTSRLTIDRYQHVTPGLQRAAADHLDVILRGSKKTAQ